eukprot:TRINITY_DN67207_c0_g1_i1.p1 TRINITY_DN67207_c0_g1~~TRINITY_DN67207_c0_g1_i1.p1  ORF type:complete len:314 (-),score=44.09 TRINITY_DN67207_c0_g1_i1:423-1289(-)
MVKLRSGRGARGPPVARRCTELPGSGAPLQQRPGLGNSEVSAAVAGAAGARALKNKGAEEDVYATVRRVEHSFSLYMKTLERTNSPKHAWHKHALSGNLASALEDVDKFMANWDSHHVERVKNELRKLFEQAPKKSTMALSGTKGGAQREGLRPINRKTERREAKRELKAENSARLSQSVEQELLSRLRQGLYGGMYKSRAQTERLQVEQREIEELQLEKDVENSDSRSGIAMEQSSSARDHTNSDLLQSSRRTKKRRKPQSALSSKRLLASDARQAELQLELEEELV